MLKKSRDFLSKELVYFTEIQELSGISLLQCFGREEKKNRLIRSNKQMSFDVPHSAPTPYICK